MSVAEDTTQIPTPSPEVVAHDTAVVVAAIVNDLTSNNVTRTATLNATTDAYVPTLSVNTSITLPDQTVLTTANTTATLQITGGANGTFFFTNYSPKQLGIKYLSLKYE